MLRFSAKKPSFFLKTRFLFVLALSFDMNQYLKTHNESD